MKTSWKGKLSQKRNHSQNEVMGTLPKKPKQKWTEQNSVAAARHFSDVARDRQVAIIDVNSTSPNTIQERWVAYYVRLSILVLGYVLNNPAGSQPKFDSSETLRSYWLIKCVDQGSLDLLTGSVAKISDTFEELKLKFVPAKDIPRKPRKYFVNCRKQAKYYIIYDPSFPERYVDVYHK